MALTSLKENNMRYVILLLLCSCADIITSPPDIDATPSHDAISDDARGSVVDARSPGADAAPPNVESWPCDIETTVTTYSADTAPLWRFTRHYAQVDFDSGAVYFVCNTRLPGDTCVPGGTYPCSVYEGPTTGCSQTLLFDSDGGTLALCEYSQETYQGGVWVPTYLATATHVEARR